MTAGATEAIAAAILALVDTGDEVVALEPYYDSYAATIAMARGVRVPVTLRAPTFRPDLDELRAAITPRTRVILLNSPHNPTGIGADAATSWPSSPSSPSSTTCSSSATRSTST